MKVGELSYRQNDQGVIAFAGRVTTLQVSLQFTSRPARQSDNHNAPTHEIVSNLNGALVQFGLAWQKTLERGDHAGSPFFSITLDDPSFDKPLNVTAFPRERGQQPGVMLCDVVWQRARGGAARATADTGNGAAAAPLAQPDDQIPF